MKGLNLKSVWERIAGSRMAGQVAETLAGAEAREALLSQAGYQGQPAGLAARLMVEVSRALPLALDAASLRGFGSELPGAQVMALARAEALSRYPAMKGAPQPASQISLTPEEQAALMPWISGQRMARLAQAFVISGDVDLARAAAGNLTEFCEHNPPLMGPGWMDEQITAIRLLNWLWCFRFLNDPAIIEQDTVVALLIQMQVAGQMLAETLVSQPEPAPLQVAPAAALLHLGCCLSFLPEAGGWLELAGKKLGPALASWGRPLGLLSSNWAAVMLEWSGLSLWLCMKNNLEAPAGLVAGLRALGPLVRAMAPPWGSGLAWGWSPVGSVLNLSQGRVDAATGTANLAAMLLTEPDLRAGRTLDERLYWLYGKASYEKLRQLAGGPPPPAQNLAAAGLAVLGALSKGRRMSLWLRTAPQEDAAGSAVGGAAKSSPFGQAQGLSMGLCLDGHPFLITPGPAGSGPLARYLASRAAFNAVRIDGAEPGPGAVSLEALEDDQRGAFVAASFGGYGHLEDPVSLRRRLFIDKTAALVQVVDQIQAEGEHDCEVFFHLPAGAEVTEQAEGEFLIAGPWGQVLLQADKKAAVEVISGQANPPLGWQADGVGKVKAAPVVRISARTVGSARLTTSLVLAT
jgi:hypothetical protein